MGEVYQTGSAMSLSFKFKFKQPIRILTKSTSTISGKVYKLLIHRVRLKLTNSISGYVR